MKEPSKDFKKLQKVMKIKSDINWSMEQIRMAESGLINPHPYSVKQWIECMKNRIGAGNEVLSNLESASRKPQPASLVGVNIL